MLLADSAIIEAAQRKPHNASQFRAVRSLNERVRMHLGNEQDKMFERYAPIQRKVKPSLWKRTIQEALDLPSDELPELPGKAAGHGEDVVNAPRSAKFWQTHEPKRYRQLQRCKAVLNQISQDTCTPTDVLLKPQILRNLCWTSIHIVVMWPNSLRNKAPDHGRSTCSASRCPALSCNGCPRGS